MSVVNLFRQIIQYNPSILELQMSEFSLDRDRNENIGELILESLLNSNIESINLLYLSHNSSWFKHPDTGEEISSNIDLLTLLILKQTEI